MFCNSHKRHKKNQKRFEREGKRERERERGVERERKRERGRRGSWKKSVCYLCFCIAGFACWIRDAFTFALTPIAL